MILMFWNWLDPYLFGEFSEGKTPGGLALRLLGDERLTMFAKTGTLWKEYNLTSNYEGDVIDNHSAVLTTVQPMAEVAEFLMSQSR